MGRIVLLGFMVLGPAAVARAADATGAEPQPGAVAVVLGQAVTTTETDALRAAVLTPLLDRYAVEQGIAVEDTEVDAFVDSMERGMRAEGLTAEDSLTPEERAEVATMRREMGRAMIWQWKVNRALYGQYGGRIVYQQLGPEPLDAYRLFLEEQQAAGAFEFIDATSEADFWRYFRDDALHDFMEEGGAEAEAAISRPPWLNED